MKCMDPILVYDSGGKTRYRHFSLANPLAKISHRLVFDCRKCLSCRKKASQELAMRCVLHASLYKENCFITLTYDESKDGYHNNKEYADIQKFKKRLRRYIAYREHGRKIKIFNVHEYGRKQKKHWHLVIFNYDFKDKELYTVKNQNKLYKSPSLVTLWPHGFSTIGDVTEASALYQAQYMQKDFKNGNSNNDRKALSKHNGIGREYFLKHYPQLLRLGFIPFNNQKRPIPRYFLKIAHKHWAHYYDPSFFFDTTTTKKRYSPFTKEEPDKNLADLYAEFEKRRQDDILLRAEKWDDEIQEYLFNNNKTEFMRSGENFMYDLKNKQTSGDF